jgi:hypothetical protein
MLLSGKRDVAETENKQCHVQMTRRVGTNRTLLLSNLFVFLPAYIYFSGANILLAFTEYAFPPEQPCPWSSGDIRGFRATSDVRRRSRPRSV